MLQLMASLGWFSVTVRMTRLESEQNKIMSTVLKHKEGRRKSAVVANTNSCLVFQYQ
jgi:5-hydroxyisourate hydrolase-like protein (transthyretin family)